MKKLASTLLAAGALLLMAGCSGMPDVSPQAVEAALPSAETMAVEAEARGDWAAAARHWQAAAGAEPTRTVRLSWARALRLSGRCGPAAAVLAPLLSAAEADGAALIESAKCHLVSGRPEAAESQLRQAIEIMPGSWEAESVLAVTLDRMGRHGEAMQHHDKANALAPGRPVLMSNKALSLALNGRLDEGVALLRQASALPGATERVRMNLALLEAAAGNGDRAASIAAQETIDDKAGEVLFLQRMAEESERSRQTR